MWPRGSSSFLRMGAQSRKVRNQPRGAADGNSVHGRAFSIAVRLLAGETVVRNSRFVAIRGWPSAGPLASDDNYGTFGRSDGGSRNGSV
jgi:hypothetical protein